MTSETKEFPMCGETILAVAKKCKHCREYLEINNVFFKKTQNKDIFSDEADKSNELTKSSTQDIDGKIISKLSEFPEFDANYEMYKIIKKNRGITLRVIVNNLSKDYLGVKQGDVLKILNDLIYLGFIYKYDYGDKVVYSTKKINQKHKPISSLSTFFNEFKNNEANRVYSFIKKYGNVRLTHIIKSLSMRELDIKKVLNILVNLGSIYKKDDRRDDIVYSINTTSEIDHKHKFKTDTSKEISNANKNQVKTQKPSDEDDINDIEVDDPEIRKHINRKPLPDLPEKIDITDTENKDEGDHEESFDDIKTNLPDEDESNFDLDKYMSDEDDSNHN